MESFTITQTISREDISDLLCSAFEGGSNYWYQVEKYIEPTSWEFNSEVQFEHDGSRSHYLHDYPLNPGGVVIIGDLNDIYGHETWRLDAQAIQKGLQVMAEKYPRHFANILAENADAETGDVFLQCCLFGDIIYG